jgi:hypothetical protein
MVATPRLDHSELHWVAVAARVDLLARKLRPAVTVVDLLKLLQIVSAVVAVDSLPFQEQCQVDYQSLSKATMDTEEPVDSP